MASPPAVPGSAVPCGGPYSRPARWNPLLPRLPVNGDPLSGNRSPAARSPTEPQQRPQRDEAGEGAGEAQAKTHVNHILAKTGLRDRAQAVGYAYRTGLAEPRGRD